MRYSFLVFVLLLLLPLYQLNGQAHVDTALSYVGVREKTGRNDGYFVERFLSSVGRKKGDSWCAAFVSYCLTVTHTKEPAIRSGLAYDFTKAKYVIAASDVLKYNLKLPRGTLVIWRKGTTLFGHIGIAITQWKGSSGKTVEGNTSPDSSGSQSNGNGVYIKNRKISPLSYFSIKYFTLVAPKGNKNEIPTDLRLRPGLFK